MAGNAVGLYWEIDYGEISENKAFRILRKGASSPDVVLPIASLSDFTATATAMLSQPIDTYYRGAIYQGTWLSNAYPYDLIISYLSYTQVAPLLRFSKTELADLVSTLGVFTANVSDPEAWDGSPMPVPWVTEEGLDEAVTDLVKDPTSDLADALSATFASQFTAKAETTTAQIQAWLSAPSPLGVKRLIGAHTLTDTLTPAAGMRVDLTEAVLTLADGGAGSALTLSADDVSVIGGVVDGNRSGRSATSHGIVVTGDRVTIRDTQVINCRNFGIHGVSPDALTVERVSVTGTGNIGIFVELETGVAYRDLTIRGCLVDRTGEGSAISEGGIKVRAGTANLARNVKVLGNTVRMPNDAAAAAAISIEVWDAPGAVVNGNYTAGGSMGLSIIRCNSATINGNTCFDAKTYGIEVGACSNTCVDGNAIDGNGHTARGIALTFPNSVKSEGCVFSGNTVRGCTVRAFYSLNADVLSITGNVFAHPSGNIIDLQNGNDITLAGNMLDGLATANKAIVLDNCTDVTITGNALRRCAEHGVLVYSTSGAYTATDIVIVGNIFRGVNSSLGSAFSGGAAWGARCVVRGNTGQRDILDVATLLVDAFGTGSPENAVAAGVGSTYHQTNGGANTSLYVKESGTGNTGWVAK